MRIAHLILAHRGPSQLARLAERITHVDADIYIHLDKKTNIAPFRQALAHIPRCYFVAERENIHWSAYSMVKATTNAFSAILSSGVRYDFVNLMSGADYPLKPSDEIHDFLENQIGYSFIAFEEKGSVWWEKAQERFSRFYFNDVEFRGKYFVERLINRVLSPPVVPPGIEIVGRSQWMTLYTPHVDYILEFLQRDRKIQQFFRFSWAPDESLFQTILYNSPFRNQLVNDNLRYVAWPVESANPKTLVSDDYDALMDSDKLYARKFAAEIDVNILDLLDQRLKFTAG